MPRRLLVLLASLLVTLALTALTACGGTEEGAGTGAGAGAVRTAENGDRINDADVAFATEMIPHHAQALEMVDLTVGRTLRPEVRALAEQVREAQAPEIEQLTGWLTEWGEEVPATSRDHVNSGHDSSHLDQDMPGMMTTAEMDELAGARGAAFESMWLEMMVEHHRGAVEMARAEQASGHFEGATALAGDIATAQEQEIVRLTELLGS